MVAAAVPYAEHHRQLSHAPRPLQHRKKQLSRNPVGKMKQHTAGISYTIIITIMVAENQQYMM